MAILKQSTPYTRLFRVVAASDHTTGVTGATLAVYLSKAGFSGVVAAGTTGEIDATHMPGLYGINLVMNDTNTVGDLGYRITATGGSAAADPTIFVDHVQSQVFTDLNLNASGQVAISSSVKINQALVGFQFMMTSSTTNAPLAGLGTTIVATRSLGGGGWGPCANTPTEVGNGLYAINLNATDTNNACVALRFTATGANDNVIVLITQP